MQVIGQDSDARDRVTLGAKPDSVATYRIYVTLPREELAGESTPLAFILRDELRGEVAVYDAAFRGPAR